MKRLDAPDKRAKKALVVEGQVNRIFTTVQN